MELFQNIKNVAFLKPNCEFGEYNNTNTNRQHHL